MPKGRVSIVVERCKACAFWVEFCPTHVLALSAAFNSKGYPPHIVRPEKCSACDRCGVYCADFAIYGMKVYAAEEFRLPVMLMMDEVVGHTRHSET